MKQEKMVTMAVRMPKTLRDAFTQTAKQMDSDASKELRKFMRAYVAKNGQTELFK